MVKILKQILCPQRYRQLTPGELLQPGDEYHIVALNEWIRVDDGSVGMRVEHVYSRIRRPLDPEPLPHLLQLIGLSLLSYAFWVGVTLLIVDLLGMWP